ncbi:rod shape-determining protein MreB [Micromonospora viridifaciens]|uniref:Rod shape-determining protein MreB n=1 Tax=Micromonospora viridifaciens TaxID=1881 RepID=A0A1C4YL06_MICVI|nr:rod shape-determining protein [Micromonospora viridifaciens]SCF21358.1 rod shape-determining protein MreB [Micromonospora viridifaciens]
MPVAQAPTGHPLDTAGNSSAHSANGASVTRPSPIAVDLGSGQLRMRLGGHEPLTTLITDRSARRYPLVKRGRVVDGSGCATALTQLLRQHQVRLPSRPLVVACRPLLATPADQDLTRRVLDAVFAPARLLFIDTVRAAAIGAGAGAGTLLVADVGAQITEVAILRDSKVIAGRRANLGTGDLAHGATVDMLADRLARLVRELTQGAGVVPAAATALARGIVLVGDGATRPDLRDRLAAMAGAPVHRAAGPRTAALTGASLAAAAAARHPAAD